MAGKMTRGEEKAVQKQQRENKILKAAVVASQPVAPSAPTPSGAKPDPSVEALQAQQQQVMQLLLAQMEKSAKAEEAETAKELEKLKKRLESQTAASKAANALILQTQSTCSHMNRGEPRTGGQYNSDGHYNIFCLNCFKLFSSAPGGTPLPNHLQPEFVGGAVMESVNRIGQQVQVA